VPVDLGTAKAPSGGRGLPPRHVYAADPPLVVIDELAHLLPSCARGDAARRRIVPGRGGPSEKELLTLTFLESEHSPGDRYRE
jgi:hypothetical protein